MNTFTIRLHYVCCECGHDWYSWSASCPECGCDDWDEEYTSDTDERRTGGLDDDVLNPLLEVTP